MGENSADTINRHRISEDALQIQNQWKTTLGNLKDQKENLASLALQWEDFDQKSKSFDSQLLVFEQQYTNISTTFISIRQMSDSKKSLTSLLEDVRNMDGKYKDVQILSNNIIKYLESVNMTAKQELESKMEKTSSKYKCLITQLEERVTIVEDEINNLEGVDKKVMELQDKINRLGKHLSDVKVWHQNHAETEAKLVDLRQDIETVSSQIRELHTSTRKKLSELGQSLPSDTADKLANVELLAEQKLTNLEDRESEHKRAKNIRFEFQVDVEEVQFWISRSESKIQDRTLEPHILKNNLNDIQSEINGISEQLDKLLTNGKIITEKTDNNQEKELVLSTTNNLSEQISTLKNLIQEKKNAANDAIDAWQRFLQFHSALKTWCDEKDSFLKEPFCFTNLSAAKLKLQDYNTAIKSTKNASKNLMEMEKELKKIFSVSSSGDLADKLSDIEKSKSEIESNLMEKNATLLEMTEEWGQCEKKLKETKAWISKGRDNLESLQSKKRPIRDQINMREKMLSDITIQKKRADMALEKLKVHFREEITTEQDIQKFGKEISEDLNALTENIKDQCKTLESCLTQLDQYQQEIGVLRQQILACEGELRTVSSPAYTAKDRDKALVEQSACRERIKGLRSKITAFSQRMNLINQRGTPDEEEMKRD